jgi:hypothetical protein
MMPQDLSLILSLRFYSLFKAAESYSRRYIPLDHTDLMMLKEVSSFFTAAYSSSPPRRTILDSDKALDLGLASSSYKLLDGD